MHPTSAYCNIFGNRAHPRLLMYILKTACTTSMSCLPTPMQWFFLTILLYSLHAKLPRMHRRPIALDSVVRADNYMHIKDDGEGSRQTTCLCRVPLCFLRLYWLSRTCSEEANTRVGIYSARYNKGNCSRCSGCVQEARNFMSTI